jgi:hypothetical protein
LVTFFPFCCLFSFVKRLYRLYRLRSQKKLDNIELRRFFWLLFSRFWLLFSRSGYIRKAEAWVISKRSDSL